MTAYRAFPTIVAFLVAAGSGWSQATDGHSGTSLSPIVQTTLYSITAADLRGELSFIASDALQGRYTPSPGLDIAAEYIASQFRAAGLEPGGGQDYFQAATMIDRRMPRVQADTIVQEGQQTFGIPPQFVVVLDSNQAVKIDRAPVLILAARDPELSKGVDLSGKAVIVPAQPVSRMPREQMGSMLRKIRAFDRAISSSNAAVEILVGQARQGPNNSRLLPANEAQDRRVPSVTITNQRLQDWLDHPQNGVTDRAITLDIPAPDDHRVVLKNVVSILRGSDPVLKSSCVLLTAHYDHIGTTDTAGRSALNRSANPNDHIYNGANDDGSGTVSVISIAKALSRLNPRPRRSVVFITFFGEERGELGSQYYGKHPIFPIEKTVADINLEQVGRTDSTVGRQLNNASLTGYDYSDVTKFLEAAGRAMGIKVYLDREASDAYFTRSDNAALAELGVPAHTLTVAFDYPDYHGLDDQWQKIDYENMAKVDRMVALAVFNIANSEKAPQWNSENPKTMPFREAQKKLRP